MGPDQDWDAIKAAGVKLIREDFVLERDRAETRRVYDFSAYDRLLDSLDKREDSSAYLCWITAIRSTESRKSPEEGRDAFAKWAAAWAKHFKGRNMSFGRSGTSPTSASGKGTGKMNSVEFADQYAGASSRRQCTGHARCSTPSVTSWAAGRCSCLCEGLCRSGLTRPSGKGCSRPASTPCPVHPYRVSRDPELCINASQPGGRQGRGLRASYARRWRKPGAQEDFPVLNSEVGFPKGKNSDSSTSRPCFSFANTLVDQMCHIAMNRIWFNWDENDAADHRVPQQRL